MISKSRKEFTFENFTKIKEKLTGNVKLSMVDYSVIAILLSNTGAVLDQNTFFQVREQDMAGTLKDNAEIMDLLDNLIAAFDDTNPSDTIVQLDATNRTLMFGECFSASIVGESGREHEAEVISCVDKILTGDSTILAAKDKLIVDGCDPKTICPIQCIFSGLSTENFTALVDSTLGADSAKAFKVFQSFDELMDSLAETNGFILKTDNYYVAIYEGFNAQTNESEMVVKLLDTTTGVIQDSSPAALLVIFD